MINIPTSFSAYVNSHKLNLPSSCPVCGGDLSIKENGEVVCVNQSCPQKVSHKFINFFTILEIDGAGESLCDELSKSFNTISSMISNFKKRTDANSIKVMKQLEKKLNSGISLSKFVALFDLPGFGEKKLAALENLQVFDGFYDNPKKTLENITVAKLLASNIEGISSIDVLENLANAFEEKRDEMISAAELFEFGKEEVKVVSGKLSGLSFCTTGKSSLFSRKEFENLVTSNGGTLSSVKNGLSYLVTDDTESGSSKNEKAKKLGVKVISCRDFMNMI